MKFIISLFLLAGSLNVQIAFAQAVGQKMTVNPSEGNAKVGEACLDKALCSQIRKSRIGHVKGRCFVLPGGGNSLGGPCVNVSLTLKNKEGKELSQTRTDQSGEFAFGPETMGQEGQYMIGSGSRQFEVVSPTGIIESDTLIDLKIRQK